MSLSIVERIVDADENAWSIDSGVNALCWVRARVLCVVGLIGANALHVDRQANAMHAFDVAFLISLYYTCGIEWSVG